jgi:hypothetical protein
MATTVMRQMLESHPWPGNVDRDVLARCIEACFECAETCTSCADACLSEKDMIEELRKCIRLDLDCADICQTTARVLIRQTEYDAPLTKAQVQACREGLRDLRGGVRASFRDGPLQNLRRGLPPVPGGVRRSPLGDEVDEPHRDPRDPLDAASLSRSWQEGG